jgi:hypothetical protein
MSGSLPSSEDFPREHIQFLKSKSIDISVSGPEGGDFSLAGRIWL